ncbi:MAG: hypothetical protein QOC74_3315 [Pseudonocardiales bacterium]|nr:hypothetical protein [Pseudonocardiales bacterium]
MGGISGRAKVLLAVGVLVVGIGGGVWWTGGTSHPTDRATTRAASEVQLEPTSSAGANPFMPPVGQDQTGVTPPSGATGTFSGDTAGLFAESGDRSSCDAQTLRGNLEAEPAKATAWAEALGITSTDIPGYVASLNPVVLRADTAVTSYGYADNTFSAYPAVLQAGTSVFVNDLGEPRVKCFSGNPLTAAPSYQQPIYAGPAWPHFAPTTVTYVRAAPTIITIYTVVDIHDDTPRHRRGNPHWTGEDGGFCTHHPDSSKCPGTEGTKTDPAQAVRDKAAVDAKANAAAAAQQADAARTTADTKTADALTARKAADQATAAANAKAAEIAVAAGTLTSLQKEVEAARARADANPTPENLRAIDLAQGRVNDARANNAKLAGEKVQADQAAATANEEAGAKEVQAKNAEAAARGEEGSQTVADEQAAKAAGAPAGHGGGKDAAPAPPGDPAKDGTKDPAKQVVAPVQNGAQPGQPAPDGTPGQQNLFAPTKLGETGPAAGAGGGVAQGPTRPSTGKGGPPARCRGVAAPASGCALPGTPPAGGAPTPTAADVPTGAPGHGAAGRPAIPTTQRTVPGKVSPAPTPTATADQGGN